MREEITDIYNTFLTFKGKPRNIDNIITEIEQAAIKSNCFIDDKIDKDGNRDISPHSGRWFVDYIYLKMPLRKNINEDITKIFGKSKDNHDHLKFTFKRYWDANTPIQDYWYLHISGKETCTKSHLHYALNTDSYDSCRCPKQFKEFCRDFGLIIKKYSTKECE